MNILNYSQEMFELAIEGRTQGVWYWASVYALVVCSYSLWFQIRTRKWPTTKGKLVQMGVKKFGANVAVRANQDYVGDALYIYSVLNKHYEGSRISPWVFVASHNARFILEKQQAQVQIGADGGVNVYYNPRNPKKSYLIVAGKTGMVITILLGALPSISYWMKYYV
ncbi:DUF3592 domain-containing protein [Neiella sp. HB171785]|uniref:DUF3592 domain-containing protein n=1 Tax=Neiella litorisoli TaxID=2771431 RepID=A0A8J6UG12_9GAMM|nr:DUF3592 domain-containing protein [Neiella litorisoli]MBD1389446.1 DUF3592 domain-containing protein [Neiella litorisoli]